VFNFRNSVLMCLGFLLIGLIIISMNFFDIGNHHFDPKSLECIWDRMADHTYTVIFASTIILFPILVVGLAYLKLYLHVIESHRRVGEKSVVFLSSLSIVDGHQIKSDHTLVSQVKKKRRKTWYMYYSENRMLLSYVLPHPPPISHTPYYKKDVDQEPVSACAT
jgi:hypothetical protein